MNSKRVIPFVLIFVIAGGTVSSQPALKDVFENSFYVGTALNRRQLMGADTASIRLVEQHFNSITAENIMKWELVHPQPDKYLFEPADSLVAFGEKNDMFIVGHTLVWHSQTPKWVFEEVDREALLQRVKDHISTIVGRYKGRIHGWDVVNEAIEDDGSLRQSQWLNIIGEDYLEQAFEWAHKADPEAELYYNDYNMYKPGKVESVVRLVRKFQTKGIPIHGIGMQGHWGLDYPSLQELEASLAAYSELGLDIMITELDLNILPDAGQGQGADVSQNYKLREKLNPYPDGLPDAMQEKLTQRYKELFVLLDKYRPSISRVTFWGVHDGISWRNNWPVRGRTAYPLLFDRELQPKPAFFAVIETVSN
jgi:endo-1,4-beta-xylanase